MSDVIYGLMARNAFTFQTYRNHKLPYYSREPVIFHKFDNMTPLLDVLTILILILIKIIYFNPLKHLNRSIQTFQLKLKHSTKTFQT